MFEIDSALRTLVERGGSDLHVKVGVPPTVRLHGELAHLEGYQSLTPEETEKAFHDIAEVRSQTEFEEAGEADFSYSIPGLSRFRVNTFKQRGSVSIVCRAIPFEIRSVEELGLPPVVTNLAEGRKCARSWKITVDVGADPQFPNVTPRDAQALREWETMRKAAG